MPSYKVRWNKIGQKVNFLPLVNGSGFEPESNISLECCSVH